MNLYSLFNNQTFLVCIAIWELIWKGFALWRAAGKKDKPWFVALLVINSLGLLPIGYLVYHYLHDKNIKNIS